jgi:hypothetical protein
MFRFQLWVLVVLTPLPVTRAQDSKNKSAAELKVEGELKTGDSPVKVFTRASNEDLPHKAHTFKMAAGVSPGGTTDSLPRPKP